MYRVKCCKVRIFNLYNLKEYVNSKESLFLLWSFVIVFYCNEYVGRKKEDAKHQLCNCNRKEWLCIKNKLPFFFYICILQVHKYMLKYINDIISFGILSTSNYTEK